MAQLEARTPDWIERTRAFLDGLVSHYVLDDGKLVVAHAGLKEALHGRASGGVREFALYGETTGEVDEYGLPVRHPWADEYRGKPLVVYGHTPVPEAVFHNNTICVDTGCVFGGKLTALRWPERTLVSVPAARTYYEPVRPLAPPQPVEDADVLDIADLLGRRHIETRLARVVTIGEEHAAAALEAMARFAVDPRWLVYLPPTMSPPETSARDGYLEHPAEALAYYAREGVTRVICEEKHMGSRAVLVLARDGAAARRRFHADGTGVILTRTGRPFFSDASTESALVDEVRAAVDWDTLESDWVVLDAELMPWTAKARELVRDQYAAVGAAAKAGLAEAGAAVDAAARAGIDLGEMGARVRARRELAHR
jgi:polynucleotide kinase-phosphatase